MFYPILLVIIDPWLLCWAPLYQLILSKPKSNLSLPVIRTITAMNDVSARTNPKVSPDGSRSRILRVCCSKHLSSSGNNIVSLPAHGNYWA